MNLENYGAKLKKVKRQSKEQALASEIVNYYQDPSIDFKTIYFGVIRRMGYQATYEAYKEARTRAMMNPQYFWGCVRAFKEGIVFSEV